MIGIFDSGIGGLTVAGAVARAFPDLSIAYFGDTARTPYGNKSPETLIRYSKENTRFLMGLGARIIVVACNTASSVATTALREEFPLPVFEVITPAVEMALSTSGVRSIGVIGTRATIGSGVYERLIKERRPDASVFSTACPLIVPLVEEGWLNRPETRRIVKKYLHPLKTRQVDALILGCTHYPVVKDLIAEKIGKRVRVIDSSEAVVRALERYFAENPGVKDGLSTGGRVDLYVSDITAQFQKTANLILRRKLPLTLVAG
ncbi:MAG: glutamate racemase [Thermodesulfobacteriota bacterium]